MPADFRVSVTDAPGKGTYPISSFTWMLIPEKIDNAAKKKAITGFFSGCSRADRATPKE